MAAAAEGLCQEPIARVQHANQPLCTTRATRLRGGHGAATHPSTQLTQKRQVQLPSTSLPGVSATRYRLASRLVVELAECEFSRGVAGARFIMTRCGADGNRWFGSASRRPAHKAVADQPFLHSQGEDAPQKIDVEVPAQPAPVDIGLIEA